jgi:hypothetical protein
MKCSRSDVRCNSYKVPCLRFQDHRLTSFSGLVLFQQFLAHLDFKRRLARCFEHRSGGKIFSPAVLFLQLIVHLLLGYRELRDSRHYQDDPLIKRLLGLKCLPNVATLSRLLKDADSCSVAKLRRFLRLLVCERLQTLRLARITLDFDGSVQSTTRYAEGTAVGFNKKKKGARSYYPLFCTVAQTGQVLDFLHRPGNVHDSHGAREFVQACTAAVRTALPGVQIEVRMDSAFFSDEMVTQLQAEGVEFTISVPFERFIELKQQIEQRRRWHHYSWNVSFFEMQWKPKSWDQRFRFLVIRTWTRKQLKGPVQLDLFVPHEHGYEFKVIVSNKSTHMKATVSFHEGRGSQEGIFAELKSQCHLGYVPVRTLLGNQMYLLAGLFAYNLARELQMTTTPPTRRTTAKRATLWMFEKLDTLRSTWLQRAGRLTRPQGRLTLTISAGPVLKQRFLHVLQHLRRAA